MRMASKTAALLAVNAIPAAPRARLDIGDGRQIEIPLLGAAYEVAAKSLGAEPAIVR